MIRSARTRTTSTLLAFLHSNIRCRSLAPCLLNGVSAWMAFALLFGSQKLTKRNSEVTKAAGVRVSDGIQETLENIREIRATNQEDRFLNVLNDKIDDYEKTMLRGELHTGIFVNAASVSVFPSPVRF